MPHAHREVPLACRPDLLTIFLFTGPLPVAASFVGLPPLILVRHDHITVHSEAAEAGLGGLGQPHPFLHTSALELLALEQELVVLFADGTGNIRRCFTRRTARRAGTFRFAILVRGCVTLLFIHRARGLVTLGIMHGAAVGSTVIRVREINHCKCFFLRLGPVWRLILPAGVLLVVPSGLTGPESKLILDIKRAFFNQVLDKVDHGGE